MRKYFYTDTTQRFSFRSGDMLIWLRFSNVFSEESLAIIDVWSLKDGDYATLTNRWEDIPSWFELHPTEVQDLFTHKMMDKLDEGYNPGDLMDGPNIWRVKAGDTIAWLGKARPDMKDENGILSLTTFNSNALIIGESANLNSMKELIGYGSMHEFTEDEVKKVRSVLERIKEGGIPRRYSKDWRLG